MNLNIMKVNWIILALVVVVKARHEVYEGWKSYYILPVTGEQLQALGDITNELDLDFLSHATAEREGLVLVKPEYQEEFIDNMNKIGIRYKIHADNVKAQLDIDDQLIESRRNFLRGSTRDQMPYDNYQTLEVIYNYIDGIAEKYPQLVTLVEPALSYEGRPIKYLKISSTHFQNSTKPIVFIEATIHPREWITSPVATYAIHKLIEDITEPELLEDFDWIILPVANPDGYVYTFEESRFWRKTLSPQRNVSTLVCKGVDANRNFDFFWNTVGVSDHPCDETFPGEEAFSEIETRVIRDILHENLNRILLSISLHSYGSMMLYSWGHDGTLSQYAFTLHTVGISMAEAIHEKSLSDFPRYVVGNSKLVVGYAVSGSCHDYAHSIGIPLAYTVELPGLSRGMMGFHLDPQYIEQVADETWAGIAVGAKRAKELVELEASTLYNDFGN